MCFHIFAENSEISVDFASETIVLLPNGNSEISIDIIITNLTSDSLKKIEFLYPRAFVDTIPSDDENAIFTKAFKDKSQSILVSNELNTIYNIGNYSFKFEPIHDKRFSYGLTFEFPDYDLPHIKSKDSPVVCELHDVDPTHQTTANTVSFHDSYTKSKYPLTWILVLKQLNFSVCSYNFATPVMKGCRRFIRLKIGPYPSLLCNSNVIKDVIKKLTLSLELPFEIASPYDILHRFIGRSLTYMQTQSSTPFEEHVRVELNSFIETVRASATHYTRWKLVVLPGSFSLLHNITMIGKIVPLGVFPNENIDLAHYTYPRIKNPCNFGERCRNLKNAFRRWFDIQFGSKRRAYYFVTKPRNVAWKPEHIEELDKSHGFRLYFSTKPMSHGLRLLYLCSIFGLIYYYVLKTVVDAPLNWLATTFNLAWLEKLTHSPIFHTAIALAVPAAEICIKKYNKSKLKKKIDQKKKVTRHTVKVA